MAYIISSDHRQNQIKNDFSEKWAVEKPLIKASHLRYAGLSILDDCVTWQVVLRLSLGMSATCFNKTVSLKVNNEDLPVDFVKLGH